MAKHEYRTAPLPSSELPAGIPYIVGNEAAERFSFYGMKTVLFIFMTKYLLASDSNGLDVMTADEAKEYVHWFVASAYFFPVVGAIVADAFWGKYRTILYLSLVYCLGHLCLALDETRIGLFIGLILVSIGTGAIKPCVSAHVGDQFGTQNQHLLSKVFAWFYFSINLGAAASTWLTPQLMAHPDYGPRWAFGVPGVLMAIATLVFWMGRTKFIHIPSGGFGFVKESFSGAGLRAMLNLVPLYLFVAMFWALFDQTGSAWIQQAKRMDRHWLGVEWLPSQIGTANPLLILLFIPLFSYFIYPAIEKVFRLTPLRKISIGFFLTIPAFAVPAWIDSQINGGEVLKCSSEGDLEHSPVENLFDGKTDGSGWKSKEVNLDDDPIDIVIRLRERRAWDISSIRVNPRVEIGSLPKLGAIHENGSEKKDVASRDDVQACWARDLEVFVGSSRLGDLMVDDTGNAILNEDRDKQWEWKRSQGRISLEQRDEFQTLEFPNVETEYLLLRVHSNWGGPIVSLGEVQVVASFDLPVEANAQAADVWPNVAATGYKPNIVWQLLAYVLLTAAEIMVSITCLEFSYTQAPNKMKSFIMSLYLLSVSLGNVFTATVNRYIQNEDESSKLEGADYYWFFTAVIAATAVGFIFIARFYRGQTHIQGAANDISKGMDA